MYIWVILATFLAMLASYSLSIRPDMRAITVEPLAGAVLGKMIVQHRAAVNYVKYHKYPYTTDKYKVEYLPGVIDDADLLKEMPYGYELSGDYISKIFCMNENMTESYAFSGGDNSPCDVRENRRMLVTFGPIPQRWRNLNSVDVRPNADFMNAMRSMVNAGEYLGYMAPADGESSSGSGVRLIDRDGTYGVFLPEAVVKDIDFKDMCDLDQNVCLVYMSSI